MKLHHQSLSYIAHLSLIALTIIVIFSCPQQLHCMDKSDLVELKLENQNNHIIPFTVAVVSNAIHKKCLLKKTLAIDKAKQIVIPEIVHEYEGLCLFTQATHCTTDEAFNDFFWGLTNEQRKKLMSISGKDKLDSPQITALITNAYVPQEVIHNNIIPYLEKEQIERYMRCAMIARNIPTPILDPFPFLLDKYQIISHPQGTAHYVTKFFNASICTGNTLRSGFNPKEKNIIYIRKIVDQYEYHVTTEVDDNESMTSYLTLFQEGIVKRKEILHSDFLSQVRCSPDGRYIAMIVPKEKDNLVLVCVDPHADTIITKKKVIDTTLDLIVKLTFSHNSTALFCLSYNKNDDTSKILLEDITQKKGIALNSRTLLSDICINHNTSRIIVSNCIDQQTYILTIWNIENPLSPIVINHIKISGEYPISALQYNNCSNTAAARFENGNILLIEEQSSGEIKLSHMLNPYKHPQSYKRRGLLFTPDDKILIDHSRHQIEEDDQDLVTVWDIESARCIIQDTRITLDNIAPEIIISADECSFLTNVTKDHLWMEYLLYSPSEKESLQWVNNNHNIFTLYMLRRLYQAHKNNEKMVMHEGDALSTTLQAIPTTPHNIQMCIKEYLLPRYQKSFLEAIQTHATWGPLFEAGKLWWESIKKN